MTKGEPKPEEKRICKIPTCPSVLFPEELIICSDCFDAAEDLIRAAVAAEREAFRKMLEPLRGPLEIARKQARPVGEVPSNVDVYWRTGSDTVVQWLEFLDRAEPEGKNDD